MRTIMGLPTVIGHVVVVVTDINEADAVNAAMTRIQGIYPAAGPTTARSPMPTNMMF